MFEIIQITFKTLWGITNNYTLLLLTFSHPITLCLLSGRRGKEQTSDIHSHTTLSDFKQFSLERKINVGKKTSRKEVVEWINEWMCKKELFFIFPLFICSVQCSSCSRNVSFFGLYSILIESEIHFNRISYNKKKWRVEKVLSFVLNFISSHKEYMYVCVKGAFKVVLTERRRKKFNSDN